MEFIQKYKFKRRSSFHISFLSQVKIYSTIRPAPSIWVFACLLAEHCSTNAEDLGLNPIKVLKIVLRLICQILFTLRSVKVFLLRGRAVTVIKHQVKEYDKNNITSIFFTALPFLSLCVCSHSMIEWRKLWIILICIFLSPEGQIKKRRIQACMQS